MLLTSSVWTPPLINLCAIASPLLLALEAVASVNRATSRRSTFSWISVVLCLGKNVQLGRSSGENQGFSAINAPFTRLIRLIPNHLKKQITKAVLAHRQSRSGAAICLEPYQSPWPSTCFPYQSSWSCFEKLSRLESSSAFSLPS